MNPFFLGFLMSIFVAPEVVVILLHETIVRSVFSFFMVVTALSLGGIAASVIIYFVSRLAGYRRCFELLDKHGRKIMLKPSDLEKTFNYYEKREGLLVFFGRWVPTFRTLVSIPAGLSGMRMWRFVSLSFSGIFVWNLFLCLIVYSFQAYLEHLEKGLEGYTWLAFTVFVLLLVYFAVRRISEKILDKSED
ncbi:MAG: DedA family protein [Desulfonatronovibrio sp.]